MKSGIELIAEERQEQLTKHGRTIESDVEINSDGQIQEVIAYMVTGEDMYYPHNWSREFKEKIDSKMGVDYLKIIGAFAAAEIDRLQYGKQEKNS